MSDGASTPAPTRRAAATGSSSTVLLLTGTVLVLILMFNPALRLQTGTIVGTALNPILGREHVPVIITLLIIGSVMVLLNTGIRHFFTDWVKTARVQALMRQYQKEMSEARKSNNTFKMKRLNDMNPEIMKEQADMSSQQMKPMIVTMLIILPVLAWLYTVVTPTGNGCQTVLAVPWQPVGWCATRGLDVPIIGFVPRWVAVYSLMSLPVGQVAQRALKLWEYRHVAKEHELSPAKAA
ncbi:MAG: DUF106 domain-containing protein [Thermoplasmatota archaeon]